MRDRFTVSLCAWLAMVACHQSRSGDESPRSPAMSNDGSVADQAREAAAGTGTACVARERAPVSNLDLLVVMDRSGGMREEQALFAAQLPRMLQALSDGDIDGDGEPEFTPPSSLHLGVVSSDMGLLGIDQIPGCEGFGDDGILRSSPANLLGRR